ncbi:hypothetical protein NLJ89_g982 [Agrocybe chaxingu]|uniref:Fe2OG dioxygenase domain-containing protein n=1 Tax=Agrocybe chaxingu TaxID=84603 RepID=A0A9W8N0T3_9AGAR|nr:hypothetical protein NLJ89_g982 [Agrocybe chaxingu]
MAVEIVDFGPFIDGSNKLQVASAVLESFKSIGFVYLVNHGLPQEHISRMFDWKQSNWRRTRGRVHIIEVGLRISSPSAPMTPTQHLAGYSAFGREKVLQFKATEDGEISFNERQKGHVIQDAKESFEAGLEDYDDMPNIWYPDGVLPGFREACMEFYWQCYETEKMILRALALGFNLPEEYFLPFHSKADNQLRLLHYPRQVYQSIPATDLEAQESSRIPKHSDFCSLTASSFADLKLSTDDVGGLEVEDPHRPGSFIPVPPVPGSIVVNAGDFLMRWSNDTIRSTVHRVRAPVQKTDAHGLIPERFSIPYFCAADLSTIVDCIPGTWSEDRPKLYLPISAREYIMERLALNY